MQKRILAILVTMAMVLALLPSAAMAAALGDVRGHWAQAYIEDVVARGIAKGYEDNTFRPASEITRAEFATMLWRAIESPAAEGEAPFTDLAAGAYYVEPVTALYGLGVVKGKGANLYAPDDTLTREEGIVMVARAYGFAPKDPNAGLAFADAEQISDWARDAVSALYELGLVVGEGAMRFAPKSPLSRAEMAVVLSRVAKHVDEFGVGSGAVFTPSGTQPAPTASPEATPTPASSSAPSSYFGGGGGGGSGYTPIPTPTPAPAIENLAYRRAAWHSSAANYDNTAHLVTDGFSGLLRAPIDNLDQRGNLISQLPAVNSAWISESGGEEWVYVDLGAQSTLDSVSVEWGQNYAAVYDVQASDDAETWTTLASATGVANTAVETTVGGQARYVRILCKQASGANYIVNEIAVNGSNSLPDYEVAALPAPDADGTQKLTGGNWKVQRASLIPESGAALSQAGYDDSAWLPASVPDTVLVSYLKAGAIPDPNYDDWMDQVSDAYFTANFWYRDSFPIPASQQGQKVFLNFDAINWKADVYFNGHFLPNAESKRTHSIEGAFIRGKFDVTNYVSYGGENYVAVLIHQNETPDFGHMTAPGVFSNTADYGEKVMVSSQSLAGGPWNNGGHIGYDNPTFHAAIGWDWLPTIRGRDIGIYNEVFVSYSGGVELEDPWIETDLDVQLESSDIGGSLVNLALGKTVTQPTTQNGVNLSAMTDDNLATEWVGDASAADPSFTLDLGAMTTLGAISIIWGEVPNTAAYETQNAAKFKIEASDDGVTWRAFDYTPAWSGDWFPGFPVSFPEKNTLEYEGHTVNDLIAGGGHVMSFFGWEFPMLPASPMRYVRFTTIEKMNSTLSSAGILPPKIQEIRLYTESTGTVGNTTIQKYTLDDSKADLTFRTELHNSGSSAASATVSGVITPGNIPFSGTFTIPGGRTQSVEIPGIVINSPDLWWPNTYGDQPLYTADVQVSVNGAPSDSRSFQFGVREFTYPIAGNYLTLFCNGTRIVAKGGNWGMDDGLKLNRAEDYDNKVRLTAEENLVMIRNWVGQTNNEEFYKACDKYGMLVWDDFWLANPADGPDPSDDDMFVLNAIDKVKRYRYHAAQTVYVGRNESNPPEPLNTRLDQVTKDYDGTRIYFPNSAVAPVGSGGGYALRDPKQYFNDVPDVVLRSETGIPNVPDYESIVKFLSPENQWPISESWALHDFTFYMNGPANTYIQALKSYKDLNFTDVPAIGQTWGQTPDLTATDNPAFLAYRDQISTMARELAEEISLKEFAQIAQMINYENHRGLFEGLTAKRSNGFLMWMSQPSFPSFMWQTYDYYMAANGGYFGVKAANQPTHAFIDPRDDRILLSNSTTKHYQNVKTTFKLYDLNGVLRSTEEFVTADLEPDAYGIVLKAQADFSASPTDVLFFKLIVTDENGAVLGENLYWYNKFNTTTEYQNYRALDTLADVALDASVSTPVILPNGNYQYTISIANDTSIPALQARIKTVVASTGADVLPVFYSDNYVCLMPGDAKTITAEFNPKYLDGGTPSFLLDGFNIPEATIR